MCLYVSGNKIEKAKEDIVCYKNVRIYDEKEWHGIFKCTPNYKFNEMLTAQKYNKEWELEDIDHLKMVVSKWDLRYMIEEGFHAYMRKEDMPRTSSYPDITGKICIIPKGSEYCKGVGNEIVSKHMIVFSDEKAYKRYRNLKSVTRTIQFFKQTKHGNHS